MKKQSCKSQLGITIIALVITIVIMLILAGISMAMLTGNNGIINKANNAKIETEKSQIKEETIEIWNKLIKDNVNNNLTTSELVVEFEQKLENNGYTNAEVEYDDTKKIVTVEYPNFEVQIKTDY